jgi:hypothetical protein
MKQQMEQEIQQLKLQLEQDEQHRTQLTARRAQAEQRRNDLRLKHKDEVTSLFIYFNSFSFFSFWQIGSVPLHARYQLQQFESQIKGYFFV